MLAGDLPSTISQNTQFIWNRTLDGLPNGSRLSCGAPKKDSFHNLRAPPASSACQAVPSLKLDDARRDLSRTGR